MFKIKEATSQAQHKKARALAIFYITLTLAYMVTIYRFSSLPGSQVSLPAPDYVMHALEYFGLGVLLGLTARSAINMYETSARPSNSHFLAPIFIGFAYALSDEFHQFFVPGRNASVSDLLADLSGVIAAQILLQYGCRPALQPALAIARICNRSKAKTDSRRHPLLPQGHT